MRKFAALLICVLLCVCCAFSGFAVASPDLTRTGSLHFRILSDYDPVPGGDLWLMRVADMQTDPNTAVRYTWVPELSAIKVDPMDAFSYDIAKTVLQEAQKNGVPAKRAWIGSDGRAAFENLQPGLYLFYQIVPPAGYTTLAPYLVSVPMYDGTRWVYDVDVSPKPPVKPSEPTEPTGPTVPPVSTSPVVPPVPTNPTSPTSPTSPTGPTSPDTPTSPTSPTSPTEPTGPTGPTEPTSPTSPTEPTSPTKPTKPTKPTEPDETTTKPDYSQTEPPTTRPPEPELPKTGQLKWPVAVLAGVGGLLVCCGLILRSAGRREEEER